MYIKKYSCIYYTIGQNLYEEHLETHDVAHNYTYINGRQSWTYSQKRKLPKIVICLFEVLRHTREF